jgi:hypothetical protein
MRKRILNLTLKNSSSAMVLVNDNAAFVDEQSTKAFSSHASHLQQETTIAIVNIKDNQSITSHVHKWQRQRNQLSNG